MTDDTNAATGGSELPHESEHSECDQVLRDVWLFLDNEMDAGARAAVQRHLDDCSPCLDETDLEQKFKDLVHRTCGGERAPEQLRNRLTTAISAVTVTAVTDTGEQVQLNQVRVVRTVSDAGDPTQQL
ncbi:mycothiol system anti-sigma-R factor [Nakamurella lactea]|uniref:mycothiol system anti-sigma-R factor n=1 Tax=Nakamurella lactea TaxID=459515 RepID=UPI00041805C7|nr:mycothiol system anti-sigma-R factor [Nakamurella lactea]